MTIWWIWWMMMIGDWRKYDGKLVLGSTKSILYCWLLMTWRWMDVWWWTEVIQWFYGELSSDELIVKWQAMNWWPMMNWRWIYDELGREFMWKLLWNDRKWMVNKWRIDGKLMMNCWTSDDLIVNWFWIDDGLTMIMWLLVDD